MEIQPLKIPVGFNTATALKDAQRLSKEVETVLARLNLGTLDSKTLTFIKNLTIANNKMNTLAEKTEALGKSKIPVGEFVNLTKELDKATKEFDLLLAKQEALEKTSEKGIDIYKKHGFHNIEKGYMTHLKTKEDVVKYLLSQESDAFQKQWHEINDKMNEAGSKITSLNNRLAELNRTGSGFVLGKDTPKFDENLQKLNVLVQTVNILLQKQAELNNERREAITYIDNDANAEQKILDTKEKILETEEKITEVGEKRKERYLRPGPPIKGAEFSFSKDSYDKEEAEAEQKVRHVQTAIKEAMQRMHDKMRDIIRGNLGDELFEVVDEKFHAILDKIKSHMDRLYGAVRDSKAGQFLHLPDDKPISRMLHGLDKVHNKLKDVLTLSNEGTTKRGMRPGPHIKGAEFTTRVKDAGKQSEEVIDETEQKAQGAIARVRAALQRLLSEFKLVKAEGATALDDDKIKHPPVEPKKPSGGSGRIHEIDRTRLAVKALMSAIHKLNGVIDNFVKGALRKLVNAFKSIAQHLLSSKRHHADFGRSLKHSFSLFLRYGLGVRGMFMLVRRLRSAVKEAFSVMAQEITEVNVAISTLGTTFKQLKAGLGTMFQPLLQALAPILNAIMKKVADLMNSFARFFATLTGQNYIYEATVQNYDYAKSIEDAAKANNKALASFDKLNVIQQHDDKDKNGLGLDKDTVTYKKVEINPEDHWYTRLAEKIAEGWRTANMEGASHEIALKLAGVLDDISWDDIEANTTKFATTLATGINGITLPEEDTGKSKLADSIGKTIAAALQVAINTFDTFITTVKWDNLGKFIATAIDSLKTKLRENDSWKKAGTAFGHLLQGLISLGLELFVNNNIFSGLGDDLNSFITSFIEDGMKINKATGHTFLYDFGLVISTGILQFLRELEKVIDGSKDDLNKGVNELFKGIDVFEIAKSVARVFLKGLKLGLSLLVSAGAGALGLDIDSETAENIAEAIGIGAIGLKIADLISKITGSGGLLSAFRRKDSALGRQSKKLERENALSSVLGTALAIVAIGALDSATNLGKMGDALGEGTPALSLFTDTEKDLSDSLEQHPIAKPIEDAAKAFNDLTDGVKTCYKNLKKKTTTTLDDVKKKFNELKLKVPKIDTSSLANLVSSASGYIQTLKDMFNNADLSVNADINYNYHYNYGGSPTTDNPPATENPPATKKSHTQSKADSIYESGVSEAEEGYKLVHNVKLENIPAPKGAPYSELQKGSVEATRKANIQANKEYFQKYILDGYCSVHAGSTDYTRDMQLLAYTFFSKYAREAGFSNFDDAFADVTKFTKIVDKTKTSLTEVMIRLSEKLTGGVWNAVKGIASTGYNWIKSEITNTDWVGSMEKGLQNFLNWLPSVMRMALPIPYLAQGTVVPPSMSPFLAVMGDNNRETEVVSPVSTIEAALRNVLREQNVNVTFKIEGDPSGMFKIIQKESTKYTQRTGESAFA